MSRSPAITFGMIVLNGMPFLPYNLRALYPFAHQIIVVEGASPGGAVVAAPTGHSRDGTLEELQRFAAEEDPQGKLVVVTAEDEGHPDGRWPGEKDEQSRAYASRATGEYLWQVDVDEFYLPDDMQTIIGEITRDPGITAVTFPTLTFWGDLGCVADSWYLHRGAADYHRLFRWGPGYSYHTHRPPTVLDDRGRDTRTVRWLDAKTTARLGVRMHHYSLLLPKQVREKMEYYTNWGMYGDYYANALAWLADSYLTLRRPYRVHNDYKYPSWLQRFDGRHPPQIEHMMIAIDSGALAAERRPMSDAYRLLDSPLYAAGRAFLRLTEPLDRHARQARYRLGAAVRSALARQRQHGGPT